jgi:aqualysin 1
VANGPRRRSVSPRRRVVHYLERSKHAGTWEGWIAVSRIAILFALVVAATLLATGVAFTQTPEGEDADPYIVVLEESADNPSQVAEGIEGRQEGFEVGFVYSEALEGFSAEIPDDSVQEVRNNRQVDYIERDKVMTTNAQTLPWGVNRIGADESSTTAGDHTGAVSGVNVYVIDTGIAWGTEWRHPDLNVVKHVNRLRSGPNRDCDGHGTHVAGTLAAKDNSYGVVGVAPGAPLTGVKVLDCRGRGYASDVIRGIDWVTENAQEPAVANMSLSGGRSKALNTAVRISAASGILYSLSAGNERQNACKSSPAMVGRGTNNGVVTTAATNRGGREPSWSNYGTCVDIWAPGAHILSTKLGGGTTTESGTSMAAPHVGGTAALYLSSNQGVLPAAVERTLKEDSRRTGSKSKDGRWIQLVNARGY